MMSLLKKMIEETVLQRQPDEPAMDDHALQAAVCALLLEVAHADTHLKDSECRTLVRILQKEFDLPDALAEEMIEAAEERRNESVSYWEFARILKAQCSVDEREHMLELLWKVVYADRELEGHEDAFMRQCAGALGLPHEALIRAKLRALPEND